MESLIAYPENKKQLAALKAVMKALDIPFEIAKPLYNLTFVAKIQDSWGQAKRGETRVVNINDL